LSIPTRRAKSLELTIFLMSQKFQEFMGTSKVSLIGV
jgi:hypothetical protein